MALVEISCTLDGGSDLLGHATFHGAYGDDSYGGSPYGSTFPAFGVESALPLSPTRIRVRYTAMFDAGFSPLLSVTNYLISPSVTINSVVMESTQSVLLNVEPPGDGVYTLSVADARGFFREPLSPFLNSAQFVGVAQWPSFYAVATRQDRVRAVFSEAMLLNDKLIDPTQYLLTDLNGRSIVVNLVTTEQPTDVRSTVLHLGDDLVDEQHYRLTVLSGIVPPSLAPLSPDTSVFQWVDNPLRTQIPLKEFSGEVMDGRYGIHDRDASGDGKVDRYAGVVFFSPALEESAPNSIIEVEQVDVCTRAYDEYHFPPAADLGQGILRTHGSGKQPTPTVTTLNSANWVLWVGFPRFADVRFDMGLGTAGMPLEDTLPRPTDLAWTAGTVKQIWPPGRVALLNAIHWKLYEVDGAAASIQAVAGNTMTVSGLTGISRLDVGKILTLRGSATAVNNGNFLIVAILSDTTVEVRNDGAGATPDSNLEWALPAHFITADNLSPFPEPGPSSTTVLNLTMPGEAILGAEGGLL